MFLPVQQCSSLKPFTIPSSVRPTTHQRSHPSLGGPATRLLLIHPPRRAGSRLRCAACLQAESPPETEVVKSHVGPRPEPLTKPQPWPLAPPTLPPQPQSSMCCRVELPPPGEAAAQVAPGTRCPQEDVKTTAHLGPSLPGRGVGGGWEGSRGDGGGDGEGCALVQELWGQALAPN